MHDPSFEREEALFAAALALAPEARESWLAEATGGDAALRERVRTLLALHAGAGDLLDEALPRPLAGELAEMEPAGDADDAAGETLGRYRLVERIGEGGVGVVYRAEQQEPIHRFVALKVIKPGMDTREVIRRFEAERQALALMEHPGIARVLDAGETPEGRPYFVMELVAGAPITRHADARRLTLAARLRLFIRVCEAVQHAHQKGVIHRDLKPSNVLVAVDDAGESQPKIIDFGIAKAVGGGEPWAAVVTQVEQFIGTPAYMSPEQAAGELDLDTRSDVYALGVLLYELLAGRPPFQAPGEPRAALDELRRRIREDEPTQLPAAVATMTAAERENAAHRRGLAAARLGPSLRGDLNWIVVRCLEKSRERRYASAHDLAEDIRRHLEDEPVQAAAPGRWYRLRKSIRRNRTGYGAGALVAVILVTATVVSTWQAARATQAGRLARERAEAEARARATAEAAERAAAVAAATSAGLSDFLRNDLLAQASPDNQPDRDVKLRTVVDRAAARLAGRFEDQPLLRADVRETLADTYQALGDYAAMQAQCERAYALRREVLGPDHLDTLRAAVKLYDSLPIAAKIDPKAALGADTLERLTRTVGADHPLTLQLRAAYSKIRYRGEYREAEPVLRAVKDDAMRVLGPENPVTLSAMSDYAVVLAELERYPEAEAVARETIAYKTKVYGAEHPQTLPTVVNLAAIELHRGHFAEARALAEQVLAVRTRLLGPEHPQTLMVATVLGGALVALHDDGADVLLGRTAAALARVTGPEHPAALYIALLQATRAFDRGELDAAEATLGPALARLQRRFGPGYSDAVEAALLQARIESARGRWAAVVAGLEPVRAAAATAIGPDALLTLRVEFQLAGAYAATRRTDEAAALLRDVRDRRTAKLGADDPETAAAAAALAALGRPVP